MDRSRSRNLMYWDNDSGSVLQPIFIGGTFSESMTDNIDDHRGDKPCLHTYRRLLTNAGAGYVVNAQGAVAKYPVRTILTSSMFIGGSHPIENYGDSLSECRQQLYSACAEAGRSDFHAISFLRELESTYSMLRNPFKLASNIKKALRANSKQCKSSAKWRKFAKNVKPQTPLKRIVKTAEDTWLEGTYGWNPFIGDLIAATSLARAVKERRDILADRTPSQIDIKARGGSIRSLNGSPSKDYYFYIASGKVDTTTRTKLWATVQTNPSSLSETFMESALRAVNIDRLGYALWDAVPYSFVIDWWLPLGDLVDRALSGPALYSTVGNPWVSHRVISRYEYNLAPGLPRYLPDSPYYYSVIGGGTYVEEQRSYTRERSDMSLISDVDSSTGMTGTRIPSGLALGHGLLSRTSSSLKALR